MLKKCYQNLYIVFNTFILSSAYKLAGMQLFDELIQGKICLFAACANYTHTHTHTPKAQTIYKTKRSDRSGVAKGN